LFSVNYSEPNKDLKANSFQEKHLNKASLAKAFIKF
jgi:hypothetical protein